MNGLLVDVGLTGQGEALLGLFQQPDRAEFWNHLACQLYTLQALGLAPDSSDLVVWRACQSRKLVLLTGNRNEKGKDSLEWTIRTYNQPDSLPVITVAVAQRFLVDADYRRRVADKILEYLFEMDRYLGTGRLWVP